MLKIRNIKSDFYEKTVSFQKCNFGIRNAADSSQVLKGLIVLLSSDLFI